ncbi:TolC family protein [Reichenbachiella carrageenanivorans]|uniref:TolC family protein n=1 Tax=Reichenbachiella carrageenanivorans TaxID=2979869 RepID=A0ABY6CXM4_9BACT|nr:TolC family protein [Reichenbachiella carrageenanivorans]UXX78474.1 TolC family protein [Reichenbachiella carrageenanivorans]
MTIMNGAWNAVLGQTLDLAKSLEMAKANYSSIQAKRALSEATLQEVGATKNIYMPKLMLQHQYTYSTGNSVEGGFFPNEGTISPSGGIRTENINQGAYGSFTSAIMEWDVFSFGKQSSNVRAAKADANAGQLDLENEIFQHQIRVADAYLLLLVSEKLTEVQEHNVIRAKNFSDAVDAGVRAQLRAGVDSSLAHAEYARARVLLLESQRNEQMRKYRLIELLGEDAQTFSLEIDSMSFCSQLPVVGFANMEIDQNPLLRMQQAKIEAAGQRALAMKRSFMPTVSLVAAGWARGAGVDNADGSYHTDFANGTQYQVSNYLLGVTAKWRVTDGFLIRNRYKKLQYITDQNTQQFYQQQNMLKRQATESEMQYRIMMEKARTIPLQMKAAKQAYTQAEARYENGLSDLSTLLQSMVVLNQAEADLAIAYSNVWRSHLMVAAAKGDLTSFFDSL